jgi:chemotaxis protein methyltransferase CheR
VTGSTSDSQWSALSDFIATTLGLHFPRGRWPDLERQTRLAAKDLGFGGLEPFLAWLGSEPLTSAHLETLASHLTVAETYFWREPQAFEALRDRILPELIRSKGPGERRLRIWSAGCATGEEPYSIAIALRHALPALRDWDVILLATDLNPGNLRRAALGKYGEWSFRNAPPGFREDHFIPTGDGKVEIRPEIREMVTFSPLNLVEDTFPSPLNNTHAMDLIFCRNVLMYFLPETAQAVGQRFYEALTEGGWLIVSASELSQQLFPQFTSVAYPGAIVYRRVPETAGNQAGCAPAPSTFRPTPDRPPSKPAKKPAAPAPRRSQQHRPAHELRTPGEPGEAQGVQTVRLLANRGNLAEALAACEQAIHNDKLNPCLYFLSGSILQEQNREAEAMAALKRALYLDPNFAMAHFALGNLAQRQDQRSLARKHFENALAVLETLGQEASVPENEGLAAGRLREIIRDTLHAGALQ